jgi:mannose-6-phosphate isomerase-like protein (cupin superfamily)
VTKEGSSVARTNQRDLPAARSRAFPSSVRSDRNRRYEVLAGRVQVTIAGLSRTYRSGEIFIVPAEVPHSLRPAEPWEVTRVLRHVDATIEEIEWPLEDDVPAEHGR